MAARKFFLFSLLFLFVFNAYGQNTDAVNKEKTEAALKEKQERELKLLEQILEDAQNLRLPENRAYVFARVGSALWQADEKAARKLFQDSLADLLTAQTEVQNEKISNRQHFQNLIYGQQPRNEILNLIAGRDAEMALEYLEKSRPPVIAEAMQNIKGDDSSTVQQYARNEIILEQRLLGLAAEQNPQLLTKRLRENMKKGFSYETLTLLKKLHTKDPETANSLAAELAESFLTLDFSKYSQSSENAGYFIAEFGRDRAADEKSLKIPDELLRRVVIKMTDDWLNSKNPQYYGYWNSAAVIEKIVPERAARLKKKVEGSNNQIQTEESQRYTKLMSAETTPDEMLAQAEKFQTSYRTEIYRSAATKYANNGNFVEAERIIRSTIPDEQTEYYLSQLYLNTSYQLSGQGKFEEAGSYVNRISDEYQRINALISLASTAYGRNQKENLKLALGFLDQARSLIPDPPETQNDLYAAINLATAYTAYDANESFRLVEIMLPSLNELIQANLVLMKFRTYGGMRQGEVQIVGGNGLGVYNLDNVLRSLKEKDFERTLQIADGFNRLETRLWLRMQLISENSQITNLPIITRRSFVIRGD